MRPFEEFIPHDYVRSTHPYAFRSGEWAQIVGVDTAQYDQPCFLVIFPDGATDSWVCTDPDAGYEFAASNPAD